MALMRRPASGGTHDPVPSRGARDGIGWCMTGPDISNSQRISRDVTDSRGTCEEPVTDSR